MLLFALATQGRDVGVVQRFKHRRKFAKDVLHIPNANALPA